MTDTTSVSETPAQASDLAKKLDEKEAAQLTQLHRQAQETVLSIGQMEVRKARAISSLAVIEEQAQAIMNAAASRLGIAPGTPWQMAPDGTVILLDKK